MTVGEFNKDLFKLSLPPVGSRFRPAITLVRKASHREKILLWLLQRKSNKVRVIKQKNVFLAKMLINCLYHYCGKQVHSVEHEICLQTREADLLF